MELEEADRAWLEDNDLPRALSLLDGLIAREPGNVKALNFAGWLRTSQRANDELEFSRGVNELKAALAQSSDDHRPVVNLAEALAAKGRAREAVDSIRPWCEAHPHSQHAWNSLGWLLGVVLGDEQAGLAALRRHPWSPDARFNEGRIHLAAKRIDEAEDAFCAALGSFRPHEAWLHLGEIHATRGHLRRALGAFRRAAEVDSRGEYTQALHQAITVIGNSLLQQQKYFLHADDDSQLSQERERPREVPSRLPPSLEQLAMHARAVRPTVLGELATDCAAIERCAQAATLFPEYSDQALWARLEKHGPAPAIELAREWRSAQLALYEELLDRDEPGTRAGTELRLLRSAIAHRDWDGAFAALAAVDRSKEHGVELIAGLAELLGDRLQRLGRAALALRAWALSESAFSEFASWASAGGEGMARMLDVNRLRAKQGLAPR
ncbi:MAG: tetratricopeptide repeat protein [Archangium sp.]|nr:tetratricopeptide repeat protein [Archangium sp.]